MFRSVSFAALSLLAACGGVSDNTLLSELDEDGVASVCEDVATEPRTISCVTDYGTFDITLGSTVEECIADFVAPPEGCQATVGDAKACFEALSGEGLTDEEICNPDTTVTGIPAECEPLTAPECATATTPTVL